MNGNSGRHTQPPVESLERYIRTAIRRIDELEGRVTVMAELLPGTPPANDELWRLARDYVREADRGNGSNVAATALQVYVREHS